MNQDGGKARALPDIGDVVPHHPPMRLLDSLDHADAEGARASLRVDPEAWYADAQGALPGWFGIELMAQTIAAYSGVLKRCEGQSPRLGYLLGTRNYASEVAAFVPGARLEVEVHRVYSDESGLGAFDCILRQDGAPVVEAQLKVFEEA